MITWHVIPVAVAIAICAGSAGAAVFKCAAASGKIEYRDTPCAPGAASSEVVDASANTIGTGESLESIRARDAQLARRIDSRRAADARDVEADRQARQWAFYEERAYRDRQAAAESFAGNNYSSGVYWPGYYVPKQRPEPPRPPMVTNAPYIAIKK